MKWEAVIIVVPEGWNCIWGSSAISAAGDCNKRQELPKMVSNLKYSSKVSKSTHDKAPGSPIYNLVFLPQYGCLSIILDLE